MADETIDLELAAKGRRESIIGINEQLAYCIKLYEEEGVGDALARRGITQEFIQRAVELQALLGSEDSRRHDARDQSRQALASEKQAFAELKGLKRDVDSSLVDLFKDHKDLPVTLDAFKAGGEIGKSTPKISAYFGRISEPLQKVTKQLAVYNDGRDLAAEAAAAKTRLDQAQSAQEVGLRMLPLGTQKVMALKGEALEFIERFNRAGKRAFEGNARMIALFNKDLILRARKKGLTAEPVEAETPTGS